MGEPIKNTPVCQPEALVPGDRSRAHHPSAFISPPRVGGAGTREKPTSQKLQVPTGAGALYSRILRKRSQVHAETEARDVNNTPRQPRNPYELPGCLRCSRTGSVRKRPTDRVTKAHWASKSKHKKTTQPPAQETVWSNGHAHTLDGARLPLIQKMIITKILPTCTKQD